MNNYLSVEFKWPALESPAQRRDLIEQVVVAVSELSPPIFMDMLRHLPRDRAQAADDSPIEKLFRVSFPQSNDFVVKVQAVIPAEYVKHALRRSDQEDEELNQHWILRSVFWMSSKLFPAPLLQEVSDSMRSERHQLATKDTTVEWEVLALTLLLEKMQPWFAAHHLDPEITLHGPSGSRRFDKDLPPSEPKRMTITL